MRAPETGAWTLAIIGREAEQAQLADAVARAGTGAVGLVIEGEPGIGKTELWRAALAHAERAGSRVLRARCAEAEIRMSYATLGDLLAGEAADVVTALPDPQRRALEVALLLRAPEEAEVDPRAVALALLGALRSLAARGPVTLAIDDVQWADGDSARALAFASRRLVDEPVLVLLARRPSPPGGADAAAGIAPERASSVLQVGPLAPDAAYHLLRDRLGLELARPSLAHLHRATGGNPLFLLEVGRLLAARDGPAPAAGPLPLPSSLRQALSDRVDRLSHRAGEALLTVAAAGDAAARALVEDLPGGVEALAEARRAGILDVRGDALRFTHPLLASVVYTRAPAAARRSAHARLGALLDDPAARAAHVALSTEHPDAEAASAVLDAADRASARGAPEAAFELATHALRLTPPAAGDLGRVTMRAADFAFAAGDTRSARSLLERVVAAREDVLRAGALVRLSTLATYDGTLADARRLAAEALAPARADPPTLVVVHRRLALVHLLGSELGDAERHAGTALEVARGARDAFTVSRATANLACVRAIRGRGTEARAMMHEALEADVLPGQASIDDSPQALAGLVSMYAGAFGEAREHLERALAAARRQGGDALSTGLLFALSELETRAGRFPAARGLADRGLAASEQTGQRTERAVLLYAAALADAHLGREEPARAAALEGLGIAERAGHRFAARQNQWALGALDLSLGRTRAAWEVLGPLVRDLRMDAVAVGVVPAHADGLEAAIAVGALEDAELIVGDLTGAEAGTGWLAATTSRCRGALRAARGDLAGGRAELETAVAHHEALGLPFGRARALLTLGVVHRRAKERAAARAALGEAATAFGALGASAWQATARAELARIGGRRPGTADLTATERRVAELAAEGRSNREIAAALFVTERTVEANLTRVYRKLGLRSRSQLARHPAFG